MSIRQTHPPAAVRPRVQCSATPLETDWQRLRSWRKEHYGPMGLNHLCCSRMARVEIDGRPYCSLHAGKLVLQLWLDGYLVDKRDA